MEKFAVDYTDLQSKLNKKKTYRLADVQHRLQKVAFDVVRFVDSDKLDDLWKIERDGDDEYIVAMYDESIEAPTKTASAAAAWDVVADGSGNLNVFYKQTPVKRIVLASLGIPVEESYMTCRVLKSKLASDKYFLSTFLNDLTDSERDTLAEVDPSFLASK